VIVDGSITQTSPATVSNLAVGKHQLQVVMDGYVTEQRDVDVIGAQVISQGIMLHAVPPPTPPQPPVTTPEVAQKPPPKTQPSAKHPSVAQSAKPAPPAMHQAAATPPAAKVIPKSVPGPKPGDSPSQRRRSEFEGSAPGG
jgi:hypothetical protein